jgi:hypothetical protein
MRWGWPRVNSQNCRRASSPHAVSLYAGGARRAPWRTARGAPESTRQRQFYSLFHAADAKGRPKPPSSLAWSTVLRRAGDLAQRGSVMRRGRSLLWHTGVRAVFLLRIRSTPCPAASSARPRRLPSPALHAEAEAEPTRRFRPPSAAFPAGREASVWASMAARDKTGRLSHGRRTNRPWPRTTLDPNRARLDRQIPERHRGARKPEREDERQKSPISAMQSKSYVGT